MKLNLTFYRTIGGYILAGIVMLAGFLYLRFPGDIVADYIKSAIAARNPDLRFSVDAVRPSFPPGIALENVMAVPREHPEAALHADSLAIRPGGIDLLRGRLSVIAAAEGYGGEVRGKVDYSSLFSFGGPFSAEATLRDFRAEKCAWLRNLLARQVTGTLKGRLRFTGTAEAPEKGTGNFDFTLANVIYPLQESFLGFEKLEFSKVEGSISFRNGAMKITQLTLTGEKVRCSLRGNILLANEFKDSQLDLNGTLDIASQDNKRVTLAIGGTVGNPKSRFM